MDAHACTIGRLIEDLDYDADICLSISPIGDLFRSVAGRWLVGDEWLLDRSKEFTDKLGSASNK